MRSINDQGFTAVEILIACVVFPIVVYSSSNALDAVRKLYTVARQYNEVYAVLSACPEIDRALDFNSLSASANCFPNNTFQAEGGSSTVITYTPTVSITDTSALPVTDALQAVYDSKVVDISVGFPKGTSPNLQLRMLITRNGIAQL